MLLNNTYTALNNSILNQKETNKSLERIASGLKINKASDDASGLAIADKLRTHASGIKQGIANANSAIAMMNIADKGISELSNILNIIKSKAIQMSTATTSQEGKQIIKTEVLKLIDNYDSIVENTKYNTKPLLKGCEDIIFQIGNNLDDTLAAEIKSVQSCNIGKDDPYKLNNFLTGFATLPDTTTNIGNTISSDIPGFENFDWNSATIDGSGNYVIEDFNTNIVGNQEMNLDSQTGKNVFNLSSSIVDEVEFTFDNFGASSEKFTLISGGNIAGEITGNSYSGNENVTTPLDTNVVSSWDYSNLESSGLGTIKLLGINQDTSIQTDGAALSLKKMTIKLNQAPLNNAEEDCSCNFDSLIRNDINPNLATQAMELLSVIDKSLSQINLERSEVGSTTNQLESITRNMMTEYINTKNAESVIRDVDYAEETSNFNKQNIIGQAGSFAQAKGNETQQRVLELLK